MSADRSVSARRLVRSVIAVVLGLLVGAAAGLAYTRMQTKTYTATTRVQVSPITIDTTSQSGGRTTGTINMDTEAQVVTSAAVLQRAAKADPALAAQSQQSLVKHTAVTVPPNSVVLDIAFTAGSPAAAQAGANAIGTAYLANRSDTANAQLDALVKTTQASQSSRAAQIDKLTQQEANYPANAPQRRLLQGQIEQLKNEVKGYGNLLVTLGAVQITPGTTLTAASLPSSPSSPSKVVGLASGLGLGLLLGLLLAWLLNRFRRRVRRPEDITQVVDLNTIAVLPNLEKGGALSEPYRRVALITTSAVRNADRIVFTTPAASPSGSRVATGVAAALLRGGTPVGVLRVNAHSVGGPRPRGLDLITVPSTDAITRRHGESLDIALDRLRGRRELLIVDAAGATLSADAQAVAAVADAVVLVVDTGTRSKAVRAAVRALDEVGAPMLGVVLVRSGLRAPKVGRGRDADADYDVLDPPTAWRVPAGYPMPSSGELDAPAEHPLVLEPPTVRPDAEDVPGSDEVDADETVDGELVDEPGDGELVDEPGDGEPGDGGPGDGGPTDDAPTDDAPAQRSQSRSGPVDAAKVVNGGGPVNGTGRVSTSSAAGDAPPRPDKPNGRAKSRDWHAPSTPGR